jgi:hypothetical protein
MRIVKWCAGIALVFAFLFAIYALFCHYTHISWGYCVEARFDKMPPKDKSLIEWLREQPGVVPHTVAIGRFEERGRLLYVMFIQSRNLNGQPPFPDLNAAALELGYMEPDGPFRDSVDRSRTITTE